MTLMLRGIGGMRRRRRPRMRWLYGITDSMDMSLSELRVLVMYRQAWRAAIHGVSKSRTWLSDWTELKMQWRVLYINGLSFLKILRDYSSVFLLYSHMAEREDSSLFLFLFSSVQFSRSIVSDSLRPHESQHARPPCPSPTPRVHSDSRPSSPWCDPAISSSVVPFSSCPQSLPASGSWTVISLWGPQLHDFI